MITKFTDKIKTFLHKLPHPIRWILVVISGVMFIIAGTVMLVFPGPGWLFIFLGLGILSIEFTWAYEVTKNGEQWLEKIVHKMKNIFSKPTK